MAISIRPSILLTFVNKTRFLENHETVLNKATFLINFVILPNFTLNQSLVFIFSLNKITGYHFYNWLSYVTGYRKFVTVQQFNYLVIIRAEF